MSNYTVGEKATRREWIGLAVLALPCLLYSMDLTVLLLAIPHLTADLKPSAAQQLWITDIYGFLIAGFLVTMGTLGDRIGRRKLLLIGAAAFGAASILAAFAPTAETLIAARALLGVAGATLAPSTLSLIRNMFHDEGQRTMAIGVWISSFSAGGAFGPLIGGVLLEHFWWGSVFLLAVPVMIVLLIVGPILLPESRDPHAGRLELLSAFLSITAVLSIIYGIKHMAEQGVSALALASIGIGLVVGYAFVRRQKKLDDPLIDISLFRQPGFSPALLVNIIGLFMAFGFFLLIAQYLQLVRGLSPLEAGLWSAPSGIVFIIGSMTAPMLIKRIRRVYVIAMGFFITAIGFALLTQIGESEGMALFMTGYLLICLGIAPVGTLTTDMILSLAPPERAGAASAISETSFEFGGALGIAVLGSIVMVFYRGLMEKTVPADTPREAMDTLAGAVSYAQTQPGDSGAFLIASAQDAFTQSVELSAGISTVAAVLAGILALILLRRLRPVVG